MNRHITNFLFVLLFLITMCIRGFSQQQIEATLNNYYNNYAPERLHFHLDREVYAAGDTVWFKVYVMQGFSGSQQSKNLYVDWIDDNAKILAHQIYPITESGVAAGLFALPNDFKGTVLHLHAYTKWMLNFDSAFLYNRDIRIVQQFNSSGKSNNAVRQPKSSDAVSTSASSQISSSIIPALTFFPEGGNMVAGISNRIAFLCCDPWGRPVNIAGEIKDSKGNKVADFQTKHDGMGVSNLLPYSGETYTAEWKDERGNVHQTALPSIMQDGIVLKIDDAGENKRFVIQRSDNATDNLKQLHIVATMQQRLVYMANVNLNNATGTTGFIPETSLPAGGMTVTVFDNNWQPIAERLCFVDNLQQSRFPVQITWEKKSLDKRGYNQLLLTLPDSVPANLSLSITDMGLPKDSINNNNIFSELLLTGDIRGRVYNPDYYFSDTTDEVKHNLDLVMMTHGWRKYDWNKIVKGEYPQIQYPRDSSYFTLSGEVSGISKKKIEAAKSLFVVIKGVDSSVQNQIIPINEGGGFDGKNILLFDSTTIYYRLSGMKGIANYIKLKLNQSEVLPVFKGYSIARNTPVYAPNNTQAANNQRLSFFMTKESDVKAHQLADVQVITHMKTQIEKMDDLYVNNPVFKGSGAMRSYTFDIEHDKTAFGYRNIFSYLAGRVPPEPPGGNDATYYFLNEVNLGNDMHAIEAVNEVNINEIAYVRVFPAPFVGAPMNGSAIVIYTKKGNDIDAQPENTPFITTKGYTSLKEFYQPNYSNKDSSKLEEDIRKTIYWNPILLTNKNANKIRLAFYNNDVTSAFRVVLEGMDNEGKLTHTEQIIE